MFRVGGQQVPGEFFSKSIFITMKMDSPEESGRESGWSQSGGEAALAPEPREE